MRTTPRGRAGALLSTLLLLGTLAACGLPGGSPPDGCDTEPNDVLADANSFITHASSCRPTDDINDTDWFVRRVLVGGDLRFTCTTPTGVSPVYDLQFESLGGDVSEHGEGSCDDASVLIEDLGPGTLQVIITHGGVLNQRADFSVVPAL